MMRKAGHGFSDGDPMQDNINETALCASKDERVHEELIQNQTQTILRTAGAVCHRHIDRNDDEWSVSLCAFSRAIDLYRADRGDFLPFAQMLIKRSLIDHYRAERDKLHEIPVAPYILEGGGEPEEDTEGVYLAVVKESVRSSDRSMKEEIEAANEMLGRYGFRFFELTACSPQQEKTRTECAAAIRAMLADAGLLAELEKTRKLPIRALAAVSGVSRKTLDRYRKYIIMAALVLSGDYPQLSGYLKFVREGEPCRL